MAARTADLAQNPRSGRAQPLGRPEAATGPDLGVLDRRQLIERARRRQVRALVVLAAACVAGSLLLAGLGRAFIASDQMRSDNLQSEIAQALQTQQDYQLQRAELVAPSRIFAIAETRLHMIVPGAVSYLSPVSPGETVAQAHAPGSGLAPRHQGVTRIARGVRRSSRSSPASSAAP